MLEHTSMFIILYGYSWLFLQGPDCPFNHDIQPARRLELCKYYVQSYCRRDGCVFMHEEFPCKYYHTGSTCYQGDNCKFSHDPLTEEMDIALENVSWLFLYISKIC